MTSGNFLANIFERIPEIPLKNNLRYFLAFNPLVPSAISDISPVKGYELYYQLNKGDVVVDAGAYPGDYAIFAAKKVGVNGKVICFEPILKNRKLLEKNIAHARLNNVIIIPKGLWNKNTELQFTEDKLNSSLKIGGQGQKIKVTRLDDELKKIGIDKIDVLKMDIEGAEIEAIQGCEKILQNNNVHVAIASYHIVDGKKTCFFIEKFLSDMSYRVKSDFKNHLTTYAWRENDIL